ncbi:MAG: bifunctional 4'-phosphopantothenoylcysteine decarboxylase/phosphopantothenoylcysteine synthetase, partial [Candidatus Hydrogenedentes bacterium]|nr:bifunctional 4'-phosphopantothenoylcysteine decarboxylase/phosphopantothenoylcysteine synthetase [Candidatus Hydrogenedentota bacterium]
EALVRGAEVVVVAGPSDVPMPYGVEVIPVETAVEMAEACVSLAQDADLFIGAAAVADYRVDKPPAEKHKRTGKGLTLKLVENPDVLRLVSAVKQDGQVIVGFAAETSALIRNAKAKLQKKNLDLIVGNKVGTPESGFGTDMLDAAIIDSTGGTERLGRLTKEEVAERLFDRIAALVS